MSEKFSSEKERPRVGSLEEFDPAYFAELEGPDGWIAIGQGNCTNQRYFTVKGTNGEKLGIVGLYDGVDGKNISHTVVDPKYRGMGLAKELKEALLKKTGESFYISTVSLDNTASLAAMNKIPNINVISDETYEREFHKRKFRYDNPQIKEKE